MLLKVVLNMVQTLHSNIWRSPKHRVNLKGLCNMHKPYISIYTTTVAIRWSDLDEYGHVNHAQYFVLMQEARLKWLLEIEHHKKFSYIFPIIETNMQFRKSLNYPGDVTIKLLAEEPSSKIWILHHALYRKDDPETLYASAWIKSVCFDPKLQKTIAIPEEFKKVFYPLASLAR
jgi:acyl-CoA thioester hydrolase